MRNLGFLIVLAVHWLVIWGLIVGLPPIIEDNLPPIGLKDILPEKKPEPDPKPKIPEPPTDDVEIWIPAPEPIPVDPTTPDPGAPRGTTTPPGPDIGVRIDPRYLPTKPDYPASCKRLGQEGIVSVSLLVGPDGRVIEAKVDSSSGCPALVDAVLREARTWRFQPAEDDGKPVAAWCRTSVRFRLDDA